MAYNEEFKKECINLLKSGVSSVLVSKQMNVSRPTLQKWLEQANDEFSLDDGVKALKKQVECLSKKKKLVPDETAQLADLIVALNKIESKNKAAKEQKAYVLPPVSLDKSAKILRDEIVKDGELFAYQKEFLQSDAQFRIVLKSRQIGFSYVAAADALIGAVGGRNQLFLSASEEQALILMRYLKLWSDRFGFSKR